jgi:hypothetical protein
MKHPFRLPLVRVLLGSLLLLFVGCERPDKVIKLPPAGDAVFADLVNGQNYENTVFVNLATGAMVTRPVSTYDIAFETSASGYRVWLNTGNYAFLSRQNLYTLNTVPVPPTNTGWVTDNPARNPDSSWVAKSLNPSTRLGTGEVLILDRGRYLYPGASNRERFRKLQMVHVSDTDYVFRVGYLDQDSATCATIHLRKDPAYTLVYYHFNNGQVAFAPPRDNWHFQMGQYTHLYLSETPEFRFYLVRGVLHNRENGVTVAAVDTFWDSYPAYDSVNAAKLPQFESLYSPNADRIGFDWKSVDINTALYTINPRDYYLLRDRNGIVYRLKFLSYNLVTRGTTGMQWQRL